MAASPDATASAASRPRSICRACTAGPAGRHCRRRMPTPSRTSRKSWPPPACSRRSAVKTSGARIVLECLKREGVDTIFGLPGGAVLPIYDALYDFEGLRSEEHTSELQSQSNLVCRLLLENKKPL